MSYDQTPEEIERNQLLRSDIQPDNKWANSDRYSRLVAKYGVENAKSIEAGYMREPSNPLKIGSYKFGSGKKRKK